jgi:hypothetical protein
MGKFANAVIDGYFYVVDWIAAHPVWTFWIGAGMILFAAVM